MADFRLIFGLQNGPHYGIISKYVQKLKSIKLNFDLKYYELDIKAREIQIFPIPISNYLNFRAVKFNLSVISVIFEIRIFEQKE